MMTFRANKKEYTGRSALEVVRAIEKDTTEYPHQGHTVQTFLRWSLESLSGQIPPRDIHLSERMKAEELALSYLCLREQYGAGRLRIDRTDKQRDI